jgi:hypothetical protein
MVNVSTTVYTVTPTGHHDAWTHAWLWRWHRILALDRSFLTFPSWAALLYVV